MIKIVREVNSGIIAKRAACSNYGINRNTLARFIRQYSVRNLGHELSIQLFSSMSEDQKSNTIDKKIKELTKALELARSVHAFSTIRKTWHQAWKGSAV